MDGGYNWKGFTGRVGLLTFARLAGNSKIDEFHEYDTLAVKACGEKSAEDIPPGQGGQIGEGLSRKRAVELACSDCRACYDSLK